MLDVVTEVTTGFPFMGFLDAQGASTFSVPGGTLPPGLPPLYAVTRTFTPGFVQITETSAIEAIVLP